MIFTEPANQLDDSETTPLLQEYRDALHATKESFVIDKILRMKPAFTLFLNAEDSEYATAWLTRGNGEKYYNQVTRFNMVLKEALTQSNAINAYENALQDETLPDFFNLYPDILEFFYTEFSDPASVLEQAYLSYLADGHRVQSFELVASIDTEDLDEINARWTKLIQESPRPGKVPKTTATVHIFLQQAIASAESTGEKPSSTYTLSGSEYEKAAKSVKTGKRVKPINLTGLDHLTVKEKTALKRKELIRYKVVKFLQDKRAAREAPNIDDINEGRPIAGAATAAQTAVTSSGSASPPSEVPDKTQQAPQNQIEAERSAERASTNKSSDDNTCCCRIL